MEVFVNKISGIDDAFVSMLMSKRSWTHEKEVHIRQICRNVLSQDGIYFCYRNDPKEDFRVFSNLMDKLLKWVRKHITLLRFIDFSVTVEGLHRGGQDDWDSHAYRFNNRIIRSSTRLADFFYEMSTWYEDKILPTDLALKEMDIQLPEVIQHKGANYIKSVNGYIKEGHENNPDVKRGLYMMSIPSNFIFKINLTEWDHVYKERNINSSANPEVKQCCESIADQLEKMNPWFNRQLFMDIKN